MKPKKLNPALAHAFFWVLLASIIYLFRRPESTMLERPAIANIKAVSTLPMIILFYVHAHYLVPRFLIQKRYALHTLLTIALLLLITLVCTLIFFAYVHAYGNPPGFDPYRDNFWHIAGIRLMAGIFFLSASTGYGVLRENIRTERRKKDSENEHLRTELSFLRSQINPHFLLNVLNSMVALARKRSDNLEPMLIELASLMTYMLYDPDNEKVLLDDEIEYLRSYISLQLLRFSDDVNVSFEAEKQPTGHLIEPMLLIPLVENAFKHGIGLFDKAVIEIKITITEDHHLSLFVKNKFDEQMSNANSYGIGLNNLKKRLTLIYPGKFQLQTTKDASWFIASLNLQLS